MLQRVVPGAANVLLLRREADRGGRRRITPDRILRRLVREHDPEAGLVQALPTDVRVVDLEDQDGLTTNFQYYGEEVAP